MEVSIALLPCRKQEKIMKGIKTAVKTEWKNYVIKADADKARYHKVEYGKDNLNYVITATGLVPGKKYTFSARIRANIQETQCEKLFSFMGQGIGWFESNCQPISGKGDIDQFCAITVTPPPRVRARRQTGISALLLCVPNGATSLTTGTTISSSM